MNPRTVYEATLYHDDDEDAAVDNKTIGYYTDLDSAVRAINAARGDYWQTGGVRYGDLWAAVFGKSPQRFESDEDTTPWFVGIDGKADR